jgi:membrane-bound lytic murein transglycosylase A
MSGELWRWQFGASAGRGDFALDKTPVPFSGIPGWPADDHSAAFTAFRRSCEELIASPGVDAPIAAVCRTALSLSPHASPDDAQRFFETHFHACRITPPADGAIVTGYFEPELEGSLEPGGGFDVPVYALPDDLALIAEGQTPAGWLSGLTAARRTPDGLVPYYTRQEIEEGALKGRGLEIVFLSDLCDAFVMHVQGSGRILLPDGRVMRIGFAGKNGYPYSSIGRRLVARGDLDPAEASLARVLDWLRADRERGRRLMWENKSFIFFRVLDETEAAQGPHGALGAPLTPGRSLAVDPRYHRLGLPIWVSAPALRDEQDRPFDRLMIAQDTGSAIRGPVRGDVFWGTGAEAGRIAGETRHPCDFYILIPN